MKDLKNENITKKISVKAYYDLVKKYGYKEVYNYFNSIFKTITSKEILDNYFNVYMSFLLDTMNIDESTYFLLVEKYGEYKIEKYFNELFSLNNVQINKKFASIKKYINSDSISNDENQMKYNDSATIDKHDHLGDYLTEICRIEVLSKEELNELFKKLHYCMDNINIATINTDNSVINFNDLYSVLSSINSNELKSKLYKIYQYLNANDDQAKIINKFFSVWKEYSKTNSPVLKEKINQLFSYELNNTCNIIDNNLLNEQFDLIIAYYQTREIIINHNLRLASTVAKKYKNSNIPEMDLVQAANMGLMKSVLKFDYTKGYCFSTYALWWIRQGVTRYIDNTCSNIRIPVQMNRIVKKVNACIKEFQKNFGYEPSYEEIAQNTGYPLEKIKIAFEAQAIKSSCSLDAPVKSDTSDNDVTDFLEFVQSTDNSVEDQVMLKSFMNEVDEILSNFGPREREILYCRYGVFGRPCMTLEELGKEYGVTRERIRQIEVKIFNRLKKRVIAKELLPNNALTKIKRYTI